MSNVVNSPALPTGYHIENLSTLLAAVMAQYADLLNHEEHTLFATFNNLSRDGKSLFCRLLTRRGTILRQDKLHYDDIACLETALDELCETGMASRNGAAEQAQLFNLLTRQELLKKFPVSGHSKLNKPQLLEHIQQHYDEATITACIRQDFPYVEAQFQSAFATYKTCFFGNSHQDLTEFVISDLGHVRYEQYSLSRDTRFFQSRRQIETQLHYSQARSALDNKVILQDTQALIQLAETLPIPDQHPHLSRRYQKIVLSIARQLERLDALDEAFALYCRCDHHPSRERRARILKKQGRLPEAMALCQQISAHSEHPEALEFVARFQPALAKALGQPTEPSTAATIPETTLFLPHQQEAVELLAAKALCDDNHHCYYVENTLINGLFGLFFWDIIFAAVSGAFINPFQRGPLDLNSEEFYARRRVPIDARLQLLCANSREPWQKIIQRHFQQKQGLANPFVYWEALPEALLALALQRIPAQHLHSLFSRILQHPGLFRSGFPDLIRFTSTEAPGEIAYELVEVKGPSDKLQSNQIRWLQHFMQAGIPARVLWVKWQEPEQ